METKIVIKKADALKRVFKGVSLDSLAVGEKLNALSHGIYGNKNRQYKR